LWGVRTRGPKRWFAVSWGVGKQHSSQKMATKCCNAIESVRGTQNVIGTAANNVQKCSPPFPSSRTAALPALATDLVRRRVAVIVASGNEATAAAKAATTNLPIVFAVGADPVAMGFVASLNRPGANVTGFAILTVDLAPKRLQLLRRVIPNATRFGVLANPTSLPTQSVVADLQAAARTMGLQLLVVNARTDSDLEAAFATLSQQRVGAMGMHCHDGTRAPTSRPRRGTSRLRPRFLAPSPAVGSPDQDCGGRCSTGTAACHLAVRVHLPGGLEQFKFGHS
jgi:hypothetical protein